MPRVDSPRRPAQTGHFYPGDLAPQVEEFVTGWSIPADVPRVLLGGVVPHAGWAYSGRVAARTLHTLIVRMRPETIVFLASVHVPGVRQASVYPRGAWETPVGAVEIDDELATRLLAAAGDHLIAAPDAHDGDHAIEVQLPLLRLLAPGCRIVPIAAPVHCDGAQLGAEIGGCLRESPRVLVVASTDLTHYGSRYRYAPAGKGSAARQWLRKNDTRMVQKVVDLDAAGVAAEAQEQRNSCGPAGLAAAIAAARARGANQGYVVEYTDSHQELSAQRGGDVDDDEFEMAVGYLGAVLGHETQ
ncbi:MAG: AmmeMemoRadiSam system protein B [Planctomycetota bacterium]